MSSTNRGSIREVSDYYVTPQHEIKLFLSYACREIVAPDFTEAIQGEILDPCCGGDINHEASYPALLAQLGFNKLTTVDIRADSRAQYKQDFFSYKPDRQFSLIISNPPFSDAQQFIEQAISLNPTFVVFLLRLNFFGGQKRRMLWQNLMPEYTFVHSRRMGFTDTGGTDSIEYMHAVWGQRRVRFTKLFVI